MVATGKAVPISAAARANLNQYYNKAWQSFTTINGRIYGAPFGASSKSLVWYSPAQFKKLGVTVPTTWAQMEAIGAKFKAAGAGTNSYNTKIMGMRSNNFQRLHADRTSRT